MNKPCSRQNWRRPFDRLRSGERIGEGGVRLAIPGGGRDCLAGLRAETGGEQRHDREQRERQGVVRAIAWSDHWRRVSTPRWSRTSRPFDRLRSNFDLPALDIPADDLQRFAGGIGTQQRLGIEPALGIAQQNPADRHDGQPGMAPEGGRRTELDEAIALTVPARHADALPARGRRREHLGEVGQAPALGSRAPLGSGARAFSPRA